MNIDLVSIKEGYSLDEHCNPDGGYPECGPEIPCGPAFGVCYPDH